MAVVARLEQFPNRQTDAQRMRVEFHSVLRPAEIPQGGRMVAEELRATGVDDVLMAVRNWEARRFVFEARAGFTATHQAYATSETLNSIAGVGWLTWGQDGSNTRYACRLHGSGMAVAMLQQLVVPEATYDYHVHFRAVMSVPLSWQDE